MNIYEKMALARVELQNRNIKKSGHNKFAGYDYYELRDLMPHINEIMAKYKMLGVVSFGLETATLTIYDTEAEEKDDRSPIIRFACPMSTADLKGCHPVQNLGAVQTYTRRYLWTAAFEVVEADALDATQGRPENKQTDDDPLGTGGTENKLPPRKMNVIVCSECGHPLTKAQADLSTAKYHRSLCPACQAKEAANE